MFQGKSLKGIIFVACFGLCGMAAVADVLYMPDGQKQEGVIIASKTNASMVTIKTTAGEISIPRSKISRVESEAPTQSWTRLGDAFSSKNDFQHAVENYQRALEQNPDNLDAKQKLAKAQQAIQTDAAGTRQVLDDRARRAIDKAVELARGKQFEQAGNLLKSVQPSENSPSYPYFAKASSQVNLLWGMDRLDKQDSAGAAEKLKLALQLDPTNEKARQELVKTFQGDPTKLSEMASYYMKSSDPADQLKAAEALYKMHDYVHALQIYTKYSSDPQLGTEQVKERMRTMLSSLQEEAAHKGDYKTALAYYGQLLQYKPDADPSVYYKYEYMVKRGETNMTDPASRLVLAQYAEKLGLLPTAKEEYMNVLALDPKNAGAVSAVKRFAQADLADAREFYNSGQFALASGKAEEISKTYARFEEIAQAAQQLQAQAQVELKKVEQNKQKQAVALAQRGDDYFNRGMTFFTNYASTEVNTNVRIYNPRDEAAKYFRQAIFAWQTALQLDPTLGEPASYNLKFKIADASAKYAAIANRQPPPLPFRDLDRSHRGESSQGAR